MRMLTTTITIVLILLAGCGEGTKIEIANDTGSDFLVLELSIQGEKLTWTNVDNEDTASGTVIIPVTDEAPLASICWDNGIDDFETEIALVDSASQAGKIWICLSESEISLSYSF